MHRYSFVAILCSGSLFECRLFRYQLNVPYFELGFELGKNTAYHLQLEIICEWIVDTCQFQSSDSGNHGNVDLCD